MKKTLILTCMLFGAAAMSQAEQALTLTTTFVSHAPDVESTYVTNVSVACTDSLRTGGTLAGASRNYVPDANIGNGGVLPTQTITLQNAVTLTDDFTLAIKATEPVTSGVNYQGAFFGLSEVELTGTVSTVAVPEPATATLTLLALAGLAARRRRK